MCIQCTIHFMDSINLILCAKFVVMWLIDEHDWLKVMWPDNITTLLTSCAWWQKEQHVRAACWRWGHWRPSWTCLQSLPIHMPGRCSPGLQSRHDGRLGWASDPPASHWLSAESVSRAAWDPSEVERTRSLTISSLHYFLPSQYTYSPWDILQVWYHWSRRYPKCSCPVHMCAYRYTYVCLYRHEE